MIACVPVTVDGLVGPRWGRARRVAVAVVNGDRIIDWREAEVGWDVLHDEGTEGAHHARVASFLKENQVDVIVADQVGGGMARMMTTMGLRIVFGVGGEARSAVLAATTDRPPEPR